MAWSNSTRNGRRRVRDRGNVVWLDNTGSKPAPFARHLTRFEHQHQINAEYEPYLTVGMMWITLNGFTVDVPVDGTPCQVLRPVWYDDESVPIKKGSLMMYAGTVRVEEREYKGRVITVPNHTFVLNGARYVVYDVEYIKPVM